jgi:DNA-binding LytR/AlgR family response regulator
LVQTPKEGVDEKLELKSQAPGVIELSVEPNWRKALPLELGHDVIAVKSELQYLRVWTTRGSALVLGSLQEVEDAEGSAGMRVHRSWWVHARHVRIVRRRGEAAICELSNGREVPVSRRRKADVLARFGDGARLEDMAPASHGAQGSS